MVGYRMTREKELLLGTLLVPNPKGPKRGDDLNKQIVHLAKDLNMRRITPGSRCAGNVLNPFFFFLRDPAELWEVFFGEFAEPRSGFFLTDV